MPNDSLASSGSGSPQVESVRPGAELRAAYETIDKWFELGIAGNHTASIPVLNQIRGAHAALAWVLRIPNVGPAFEDNLLFLRQDLVQSTPGRAKASRTKKSKSTEAKTK